MLFQILFIAIFVNGELRANASYIEPPYKCEEVKSEVVEQLKDIAAKRGDTLEIIEAQCLTVGKV